MILRSVTLVVCHSEVISEMGPTFFDKKPKQKVNSRKH